MDIVVTSFHYYYINTVILPHQNCVGEDQSSTDHISQIFYLFEHLQIVLQKAFSNPNSLLFGQKMVQQYVKKQTIMYDDDLDIVAYVKKLGYSKPKDSPQSYKKYSVDTFLSSLKNTVKKQPSPDLCISSQSKLQSYLNKEINSLCNLKPKKYLMRRSSLNRPKNRRSERNGQANSIKIIQLKPQQTIEPNNECDFINNYHKRLKAKQRIRKKFIQSIKEYRNETEQSSFRIQSETKIQEKRKRRINTLEEEMLSYPQRYDAEAFLPLHVKFAKSKQFASTEINPEKSQSLQIKHNLYRIKLPKILKKDKTQNKFKMK